VSRIAIAGAGIIGMSLAWRLAQAGFEVTVYEKSTVGGEASWAGAGMLAPGGEFEEDSKTARLGITSRALYAAFVRELEQAAGIAIDLQETGAIDLAYSQQELWELQKRVAAQSALGIKAKLLDAKQIRTYWPRVRTEDLVSGYFYPGDGVVNPREVVAALRIAVQKLGVCILEGSELCQADVRQDAVIAGDGSYAALVIAAGAWSSGIRLNGAPELPPSEPVRGHLLGYKQPEQMCQTIVRHGHTYMLQRAGGLLIAGASVEHAGFDRQVDNATVAVLRRQAEFVMPHLAETTPTEVWNGLRPASDALHIGRWHGSRVYLGYGHYRNGILLAPVTAMLLANEISASLGMR
jgi:glycine oxidase